MFSREESSAVKTKKDKKLKKSKKGKSSRKQEKSDSDSNSEEGWVEASTSAQNKYEDDSWMNISNIIPTVTRDDLRARRKEKKAETEPKTLSTVTAPGQHERELNPFWKSGGTGLPTENKKGNPDTQNVASKSVGDGGLNWLRKAYQRVKEQAEEEGRSMEAVAAERWGSLAHLQGLLDEAEEKNHGSHRKRDFSSGYGGFRDSKFDRSRDRRTFYKPKDEHYSDRRSEASRPSVSSSSNRSSKPRWMKAAEIKDEVAVPNKDAPPLQESIKIRSCDKPSMKDLHIKEEPVQTSPVTLASTALIEPEVATALTDKEMNELGAKVLKAEIMGNTALAEKLKSRLEVARKAKEMGQQPSSSSSNSTGGGGSRRREEVIILTQSNARGMSRPLAEPEFPAKESSSRKKKMKVATHGSDGQRLRYFQDDEKYSLNEMFEREKFTTAEDETAMYLRMAAKGKVKTDDDYDIDDVFVDKASRGGMGKRDDERDRRNAINEDKRFSSAQENCHFCLNSKRMYKHLIIAIGIKVYLSLPSAQSLTEGHCLIVPMNHVESGTLLDEDVWSEVQIFRKGLTKMFEEQGKDTVFMETSLNLRNHPHTFIECIPIEMEIGNLAPMYFKKAILESETEWSHNKKLVDLSKKDVRHSVPKGLAYFSVDFGLQGGFAHVVEDEKEFPAYFGKEIIGGLIDVEPRLWLKPVKEKFEDQGKKVLEFEKWWKPYDWTERLKKETE